MAAEKQKSKVNRAGTVFGGGGGGKVEREKGDLSSGITVSSTSLIGQ